MTVAPLAVVTAFLFSAIPPIQKPVPVELGPKAYRDGDVVEILEVRSTSPRLEHGDTVTVKGRFHLESAEAANLCLYVTALQGSGKSKTDKTQRLRVSKGSGEFELKTTIRCKGALHLTFYRSSNGKPFGGVYFGTPEQMKSIAKMSVAYYLMD